MATSTDTGAPPVLITGAAGMLGRAFAAVAAADGAAPLVALDKRQLDVADPAALAALRAPGAALHGFAGGAIVHCAALVNVEGCAMAPELARRIIVDGTRHVIEFAEATGSTIVYPQSFLTYGDCDTDIPEHHRQAPLSLYGELKLEAQQLLRERRPDSLVVIMAGFFGGEEKDKNFVGKIIPAISQAIADGKPSFAVGDRVWQPTWTHDLARATWDLLRADAAGTYQMACAGEASFHELTVEIVRLLGLERHIEIVRTSVDAVTQNELGRRPQRAVLSCQRMRDEGRAPLPHWRDSLAAYLSQPYFNQYRLQDAR